MPSSSRRPVLNTLHYVYKLINWLVTQFWNAWRRRTSATRPSSSTSTRLYLTTAPTKPGRSRLGRTSTRRRHGGRGAIVDRPAQCPVQFVRAFYIRGGGR